MILWGGGVEVRCQSPKPAQDGQSKKSPSLHKGATFLVAQFVIRLQCRRPRFDPWGGEVHLEKKMATHSSILAWKIPWTKELGGLQSMGSPRVRHDLATKPPALHKGYRLRAGVNQSWEGPSSLLSVVLSTSCSWFAAQNHITWMVPEPQAKNLKF